MATYSAISPSTRLVYKASTPTAFDSAANIVGKVATLRKATFRMADVVRISISGKNASARYTYKAPSGIVNWQSAVNIVGNVVANRSLATWKWYVANGTVYYMRGKDAISGNIVYWSSVGYANLAPGTSDTTPNNSGSISAQSIRLVGLN